MQDAGCRMQDAGCWMQSFWPLRGQGRFAAKAEALIPKSKKAFDRERPKALGCEVTG